jgi:predicted alpha/beta hydrolase family esterase
LVVAKTEFIILPGIGNSGPAHWQSHWEAAEPSMARFTPASWDQPVLADWLDALDSAVSRCTSPPVLVAHSLACLLVAHWQGRTETPIKGAVLVAVPDPASPAFPVEAQGFAAPPSGAFRFPGLILASTDDPYAALDYVRGRAEAWRCRLEVLGPLGHINGASGVGNWPEGRVRLEAFASTLP